MTNQADADYERRIGEGLEKVFASRVTETRLVDLESVRLIIFSDQHKGQRDGADDFLGCERAYNAALAYYHASGHTLHALGDVEELWECRPKKVLGAYPRSLQLEALFHAEGRYERFWGNHDDQWRYAGSVAKLLDPIYGSPVTVREGLKLEVMREGRRLGTLFLIHGHQGTLDSDKWGKLSRFVVRYGWRNVQRLLHIRSTTPSQDLRLRAKHDRAMFRWAAKKDGVVLITGHTHRPVFEARTHTEVIEEQLLAARRAATAPGAPPTSHQRVAMLTAELEFVRASEYQGASPDDSMSKPCYFNSGCCSFSDGDVTGIEIAEGEIRLVRWPDDENRPIPKRLATARLETVFARVAGAAEQPVAVRG